MKAVIFGINGQDGYYLNHLLNKKHIDVIGISRKGNNINGSVSDYSFVESIIKTNQPDYIFNFAANSTTRHFALFENHETICSGTLNILEAVRLHCPKTKVFLSGSALQFLNEGLPINEQTQFFPNSAYAVARIQSLYASRYYRDFFGLKIYFGYFFNHDSSLRSEQYVNQKIVRTALRIANGSKELLELGNIDIQKEFGFAGDTVEAVWTLISQEVVFEAVIGTGVAYRIEDWVKGCFDRIERDWENFVVINKLFLPDYKILVSDVSVIKNLGWEPKVSFNGLIDLMINNRLHFTDEKK